MSIKSSMNLGTIRKLPKVVLDTNIIISALIFGGKPEQIYNLVLNKQIFPLTSPILIAELTEILIKKFKFDLIKIKQLEKITKKYFKIVHPDETFHKLADEDDNRVLEAALEGKCDYIITGDKDLLELSFFKKIEILTADQFLQIVLKG